MFAWTCFYVMICAVCTLLAMWSPVAKSCDSEDRSECGADDSMMYRRCPPNMCNQFRSSFNERNLNQVVASFCNPYVRGCTQPRLCEDCIDQSALCGST